MNIVELVAKYRYESKDNATPYFLEDTAVVDLYNEAEEEACRRKRLIFDKTTADVCVIDITTGDDTGTLHGSINEVTKAYLVNDDGTYTYLYITDRDAIDDSFNDWRESTEDPQYLLVDDTTFQIVPPPTEDSTLHLEVYRGPLVAMFLPLDPIPTPAPDPLIVSPEIGQAHHRYLYHWVLAKAFDMPDSDFYDQRLANKHNQHFIDYFGEQVDANRKKEMRANMPHHNKVW